MVHVLRDQLQVDEPVFWACVRGGVVPDRGQPVPRSQTLPVELVHLLVTKVGPGEAESAEMGGEEAVARLQRYWIEGE
ncbi:hypothetical protein [Thermobifida halotolerans]|uniref:hypothetical protein n=1 Tax=Thermobifida halotolerans TaxID=483545 RepID=UPI000A7F0A6B|nr:hypothetical protein [Thermobifida halotolerans]